MHAMHSVLALSGRVWIDAGLASILGSSLFGLWNLGEDVMDAFRE